MYRFGDVFKKVAASKPRTYDGKEDPASLENWLREFDKLFDAINCPEDLKINNVVYYLREEANLWWSQRKKDLMIKPDFDWEAMKEALRAKFYPPYLKKQKCLEYTNLIMGTMTVNEYYTKFIELMRFAPEIVPTEAIKAQRFEQGLTLKLQGKLGGVNFESLDDVYGRAAHLYGIKGRELDGNSGEKRKGNGNFQGNEKKPKLDGGKDCEGNLVTCYFCKKQGNREFECYKKAFEESTYNLGHNGKNSHSNQQGLSQQDGINNTKPGGGNNATQLKGQLFVMNHREAENAYEVEAGTFSIYDLLAS
ncbi:uncharacterized protein [Spinacia oleracea]|uniref:Retrotransposon gag domain-containing protein n=1 Tax=Spinacia oleracea TaxID=3562 RepID=A0A9R0J0R7_SPIOL|nr:uncharacterized protein LOC110798342 [Spinacia oleracea]